MLPLRLIKAPKLDFVSSKSEFSLLLFFLFFYGFRQTNDCIGLYCIPYSFSLHTMYNVYKKYAT